MAVYNAYITNSGALTISVINTFSNTVNSTAVVTNTPVGISVTPDGAFLYVTTSFNTVMVVRTSDNVQVATINVGVSPQGIAILPNGNFAYVANQGGDDVSVIRLSDNTIVATIPVNDVPFGVAATPDSAFVYVTNFNSNNVSVIRTSDNTVVATVPVGVNPTGVAVTPNGQFVYVANRSFLSNSISVIRTSDNTVVATIPVGNNPVGVAITPDGSLVYVTQVGDNNVTVIRTSDNTVITTIAVGNTPFGIDVRPDGLFVYVANQNSNSVSVIRVSDNTVVTTITTGIGTSPTSFGDFMGLYVCPAITLSPATLPDGQVGVLYEVTNPAPAPRTITASGGSAPYIFVISSGVFPPGLVLNPTGEITGLPTTAGIFNFTVTATDTNGCQGSRAYTITIIAAPAPPSSTRRRGTRRVGVYLPPEIIYVPKYNFPKGAPATVTYKGFTYYYAGQTATHYMYRRSGSSVRHGIIKTAQV